MTGAEPPSGSWWAVTIAILLIPAVAFLGLAVGAWRDSRICLAVTIVIESLVFAAVGWLLVLAMDDVLHYGAEFNSSYVALGVLLLQPAATIAAAVVGLRRHPRLESPTPERRSPQQVR